jgi:psp operon transcriptional activator
VEYGEVTRIGSNKPIRVDVRIVAATNEHLPALVEKGRFRADLLDRLAFEVVTLPPLRAREGDVPVLAEHFGRRMAAELEWSGWPGFSTDVAGQMEAYDWPGNVRELRNVVERSVYRWDDPQRPIDAIEFDPFASPWLQQRQPVTADNKMAIKSAEDQPPVGDLRKAVEAHEKQILSAALSANRHNQRATAKALNLSYDQLRHALKRHDLI